MKTKRPRKIYLNVEQLRFLFRHRPEKNQSGGYQNFMTKLQSQSIGILMLTEEDREKLYRYEGSYGKGGWQARLRKVGKTLLQHAD